jgi:hypothetical protein
MAHLKCGVILSTPNVRLGSCRPLPWGKSWSASEGQAVTLCPLSQPDQFQRRSDSALKGKADVLEGRRFRPRLAICGR